MTKPQEPPLWQNLLSQACCSSAEACCAEPFADVDSVPSLQQDSMFVSSDAGVHSEPVNAGGMTGDICMAKPSANPAEPMEDRPEEILQGGARYKGQWIGPFLHGKGFLSQVDGSWYDGNFVYGRKHGQGSFRDADGNRYEGEWALDKAHGYGRFDHTDGSEYHGEWHRDEKSGTGVESWANGSRYEGEFRQGKKHGRGSYFSSAGIVLFQGMFNSDKFHGVGTYRFKDGRTYMGNWQFGHISGEGIMQWDDGMKYKGSFLEDVMNGEGIFAWPNGRVYKGQFRNGKQDGSGQFTDATGAVRRGEWLNGSRILSLPMEEAGEYAIVIDRSGGDHMGIDVVRCDGKTLQVDAVIGGLVGHWNHSHSDCQVMANDLILEVNGIHSDAQRLMLECKKHTVLRMKLKRLTMKSPKSDYVRPNMPM